MMARAARAVPCQCLFAECHGVRVAGLPGELGRTLVVVRVRPWGPAGWAGTRYRGLAVVTVTVKVPEPVESASHVVTNCWPGPGHCLAAVTRTAHGAGLSMTVTMATKPEKLFSNRRV